MLVIPIEPKREMYTVIIETEWEGESFTSMFIRSRKKKETDKEQGLQKCIFYIFQLVKDNPIPESRWTSRKIPWTNKAPLILRKREERKKKKQCTSFQAFTFPPRISFSEVHRQNHTQNDTVLSASCYREESWRGEREESRGIHIAVLHCQALGYKLWTKTERDFSRML